MGTRSSITPRKSTHVGMSTRTGRSASFPCSSRTCGCFVVSVSATCQGISGSVTVDRRITPPTAASERSMIVSCHAAPQCAEACHAYQPGDTPCVPGSSHHGNVHVWLGGCYNASSVDLRFYDPPPAGHHVGSTVHSRHSARAV